MKLPKISVDRPRNTVITRKVPRTAVILTEFSRPAVHRNFIELNCDLMVI